LGPRPNLIRPLRFPRPGTGSWWAGPFLLAAGLALLLGWAGALAAGEWRQAVAETSWEQLFQRGGGGERAGQVPPPPALARPLDGADFRIRVPRLGYRAVVREGVTDDVLFGGPGHYPESAWPGQPGTIGVAAHNVYWLRFDQLRPGDDVALDTRYGTFHYHVTGTRVVSPGDRSVLAPAPGRRLALTTCWPLWAGQLAPQRLAVLAS
jgi:sortase A